MLNISELTYKFFNENKIKISFKYPREEILLSLNALISMILSRYDQLFLIDSILTVIREIILNAAKANYKRIFFHSNNLNIYSPADYQKGIEKFRESINDQKTIQKQLQASDYIIHFHLQKNDDSFTFSIAHNVTITQEELVRINQRISLGNTIDEFTEAYGKVYDTTEGAGLGIVLAILLIKTAGIPLKNFTIKRLPDYIKFTLVVPNYLKKQEISSKIKNKIIEDVETLPTIPQKISDIQTMCNDKNITIEHIAQHISGDPSLTAEVLKTANSAAYITSKKVISVNEAIVNIGLKNLSTLLSIASARKILDEQYNKFEKIWLHCNKTAFYARYLAEFLDMHQLTDYTFLSGLLHDIGKIVLLSTSHNTINKVAELVNDKKLQAITTIEEITIGISHSQIGARLAEHWNFPDFITNVIKNHHSPIEETEYTQITELVYIANILCNIEEKSADFSYFELDILKKNSFEDIDKLKKLHKKMLQAYNK